MAISTERKPLSRLDWMNEAMAIAILIILQARAMLHPFVLIRLFYILKSTMAEMARWAFSMTRPATVFIKTWPCRGPAARFLSVRPSGNGAKTYPPSGHVERDQRKAASQDLRSLVADKTGGVGSGDRLIEAKASHRHLSTPRLRRGQRQGRSPWTWNPVARFDEHHHHDEYGSSWPVQLLSEACSGF